MHVPDGFLSVLVSLVLWIVSAVVVAIALRRMRAEMGERQAPAMGVMAAAIFAGQMLNFAVAGGTSGHLMGAALATIVLGPWGAVLVMTSVVSVQAVIFQDGGLLALGANLFNMGIVGVSVSYMVYRTFYRLSGGRRWGIFAGGFLAAWLSIVVAALGVGFQLALSGASPANIVLPAMAGVHAVIGIGEGLITMGALALLAAARSDLIAAGQARPAGIAVWVAGLLFAMALTVASPLASANPDGLEWVAEQQGFFDLAQSPLYQIVPDYVFPGISSEALATILAGIFGTLLVFGVVFLAGSARRAREQESR
jgi:cobalt/nickel transport system permease protein